MVVFWKICYTLLMNNKDKMINGYLYDATDIALYHQRLHAKDLCHEYNRVKPSNIKKRHQIIYKLFGDIGEIFHIEQNFWCDYGYNIEAGNNFYVNHNCVMLDCAKIKFGDNVLIAPNCGFYTAGHPLDVEKRNKWLEYAYPIYVGNNVWIGANTIVLPNVTIGDNVVIGAGSVVTKDIPSNTLAYGSPCRVIREINEEDKIKYFKKEVENVRQ